MRRQKADGTMEAEALKFPVWLAGSYFTKEEGEGHGKSHDFPMPLMTHQEGMFQQILIYSEILCHLFHLFIQCGHVIYHKNILLSLLPMLFIYAVPYLVNLETGSHLS